MLRAELGVLLEQHKSVTTIASAQSEDLAKEKTAELTAGLPIPPRMKLPF